MLFSVDQCNNYYLQVWKNSISSSKTLRNPELVRVRYRSMRNFPGYTIHGGGFKNLNVKGNFRIQLHIYDSCPYQVYFTNNYYNKYKYNNVTIYPFLNGHWFESLRVCCYRIVSLRERVEL